VCDINFHTMHWLHHSSVVMESIHHDGSGDVPGVKYGGSWDLRPHGDRVVRVDGKTLQTWGRLTGSASSSSSPLLYPVSSSEAGVIEVLAQSVAVGRLGDYNFMVSRGYDEANGKKDGYI